MTPVSARALTIERSKFQATDLYLAKFEPTVVFRARINSATITKGAITIPYDTATGNIADVKAGMTLRIGGIAGRQGTGRVRVRSIDGSNIYVAPDSDIDYRDDLHLTIVSFYEIWPVFPKAVLNTGSLTTTFFKDGDIAYSDQNTNFDPIIVMGPHYAEFLDLSTGTYFTATGSYTVDGSTISSYAWTFPTGCVPSSSSLGTPGYVIFPAEGSYTVDLTVTASNGKTATAHRHFTFLPRYHGHLGIIRDWKFLSLDGDLNSGGFTAKIEIGEQANEYFDGDLIMIVADDRFQNPYSGGDYELIPSEGGYPGREKLLFAGFVDQADTEYDYQNSKTVFILRGGATYLQNKEMFSVQMTDAATPIDWTEITELTINKAVNHYLRWHSTVLNVTDFRKITHAPGDYRENIILIQKGELISNLNNLLKQRMFGYTFSDRQGTFWNEVDLNLITTGSRPPSIMTINRDDYLNDVKINERIEQPVSNVLIGGEAYNPPTVTGSAFLSRAPGELQTYVGKSMTVSGLTLVDQTQLNEITGLYYAKQNNRYPEISLDMAFNMRHIDILPQEYYNFFLATGSTYRRLWWNPKRLLPRKISYTHDNSVLSQSITFETETFGPPGDTIIIPTEVPIEDDCPDCNPCDPLDCACNDSCSPPPPTGDGNTVIVATENYVGGTTNFLSASPNWTDKWPDIFTDLGGATIKWFILDPYDPSTIAHAVTSVNSIWTTDNIDAGSPVWYESASSALLSPITIDTMTASILEFGSFYLSGWYTGGAPVKDRIVSIRLARGAHQNFVVDPYEEVANGGTGDTFTPSTFIQPSNYKEGMAFYVGLRNNRFRAVWKTNDAGDNWSLIHDFGAFTALAFGGEFAYAGGNPTQGEKYMYVMTPGGEVYYSTNFGVIWLPLLTASQAYSRANTEATPFFNVATQNAADIMFMNRSDGTAPSTGQHGIKIYRSTDYGENWSVPFELIGGNVAPYTTWEVAKALGRFPYDPERVYVLNGDSIRYSSIGGSDFLDSVTDKTGDWATTFGAAFADPINIIPVWIDS